MLFFKKYKIEWLLLNLLLKKNYFGDFRDCLINIHEIGGAM